MEFLKFSKLPAENINTLSQRHNMKETFSLSQDMAEDMDSYLKWWKITRGARLLSGDMGSYWESGLVQLLRKKRHSKLKTEQDHLSISTSSIAAFPHIPSLVLYVFSF